MRTLDRKLVRDVWHHRSQVATIAVVMTCGVALFVALRSMNGYLLDAQARYYAQARFAGVFVHVARAPEPLEARM
ncbi:MAG TPA: hypothetical protein VFS74_00120, partial [Gemmatimonadales bacterium]|nr:hypothetical protein [Gemmatimonadales bacterium]